MGLNLDYYWSLNPKQYRKYYQVYKGKERNRALEWDRANYMLGQYIAFAVNAPKKYPQKPFSEKTPEPKIMTPEQMQSMAKRITLLSGGKINNGTKD